MPERMKFLRDPTVLLSAAELGDAVGIDLETVNNWIRRGIISRAPIGGRQLRYRLFSTKEVIIDGKPQVIRAVYVYWFVADDAVSASVSGFQRMWWFAKKRLTTGVLQRWSYVSCFTICHPGQEGVAFEKIKQFIAVAVPEFQLYPKAPMATAANQP